MTSSPLFVDLIAFSIGIAGVVAAIFRHVANRHTSDDGDDGDKLQGKQQATQPIDATRTNADGGDVTNVEDVTTEEPPIIKAHSRLASFVPKTVELQHRQHESMYSNNLSEARASAQDEGNLRASDPPGEKQDTKEEKGTQKGRRTFKKQKWNPFNSDTGHASSTRRRSSVIINSSLSQSFFSCEALTEEMAGRNANIGRMKRTSSIVSTLSDDASHCGDVGMSSCATADPTQLSLFVEAREMISISYLIYHLTTLRVHARRSGNGELMQALELPQTLSKLVPTLIRNVHCIKEFDTSTKADDFAQRVLAVMSVDIDLQAMSAVALRVTSGKPEIFHSSDDEDDLRASSVYCITINRSQQRITVVFRGTAMDQNESGANHWKTNMTSGLRWEGNPISEMAKDTPFFHVHKGIMRASAYSRSSIVGAINAIKQTYPETASYQLYVAGHSLGGALAILFGYHAALDPSVTGKSPVCVYTFGAPAVGDDDFAKVIRHLEDNGRLRIGRICNTGDIVPCFHALEGKFKHVGIEIELDYASLKVKSKEENKTIRGLLKATSRGPKRFLRRHSCESVDDLLDRHQSKLNSMTLEDLYSERDL